MFDQLKYDLKHNRKNVMRNATAWFIFGAIILVFVFWGLTPRNQSVAQGGAAAVVNDQTISLAKLSNAVERMRRDPRFEQLQNLSGDTGRQYMQQQALQQLIQSELIRQATVKEHIWTSDAEVAQTIFEIPAFQEKGQFSSALYRNLLEANRTSPAEFEEGLREDAATRRTFEMFNLALAPMASELAKESSLSNLKANLDFVSFPVESVVAADSVSAADVKEFLAKTENQSKVKDYFTSHKTEFSTPERAKVRHILIRAAAGDADAEKKGLEKANEIEKRAKKEDFGKLASQVSEDPGSKSKGGVIDYFARGQMVPEFEDYAFKAPINEISQPIKTQYGYHIIQVLDRKPAQDRTIEVATDEIAKKLIAQDRSQKAVLALEEALKKEDSAAVQKFAADHKLTWAETGAFAVDTDSIPKIGNNADAVTTAFQLTDAKPYSTSLVRQGPTAFVIRHRAVPAAAAKDANDPKEKAMQEMMAARRPEDSIRLWVDGLRKDAKVTVNAKAGSSSGGGGDSGDY